RRERARRARGRRARAAHGQEFAAASARFRRFIGAGAGRLQAGDERAPAGRRREILVRQGRHPDRGLVAMSAARTRIAGPRQYIVRPLRAIAGPRQVIARLPGIAAALILGVSGAQAHTRSESHSAWQVSGPAVRLQFTVPDLEARRLSADGRSDPGNEALIAYLAKHVGVSAASLECPLDQPPRGVAAAPGYRRVELQFRCA